MNSLLIGGMQCQQVACLNKSQSSQILSYLLEAADGLLDNRESPRLLAEKGRYWVASTKT